MKSHKTSAIASSLSNCTHITTSSLGTLPIAKAYNIQSIIDNNGILKALDTFRQSASSARKTNTLENEIDHKKDRNYIASNFSKINGPEYDQETISYARKVSSKLSSCGNLCWVNSKTQKVRGYMRCKNHACPTCIQKKLSLRIKDFNCGLTYQSLADLNYEFLSLVTVTAKRKPRCYTEMRKLTILINKTLAKILNYRKYRENVSGTVRSIEAPESNRDGDKGAAHLHLHLLATHNKEFLFFAKKLEKKLSLMIGEEVTVNVKTEKKEADKNEALEQLKRGFNYVHKVFGLKKKKRTSFHPTFGKVEFTSLREQSIEFYLNWTRASKGLRLYNSSGFIRDTLKLGREDRESSYDAPHLPNDETDAYQRTNETLLVWKRREVTIKGVVHDLGSYYVSPIYFEALREEMRVMLPPKSKSFINQKQITNISSKIIINDRFDYWKKKESQLELNFNGCKKRLKYS